MQPYDTIVVSAEALAISDRYTNAYRVSNTVDGIGGALEVVGILVGGGIALLGGIGASQLMPTAAGFLTINAIVAGALTGGGIFVLGVLVSAVGQIQKATLDIAVNSSPFLDDDMRSRTMSPGTRPKARLVVGPAPGTQEAL